MNVYLDTSALVKLYHDEEGSEQLLQFISDNINKIYLAEIAILEFRSALWRKVRTKEIDEGIIKKVIEYFGMDIDKFYWIKMNENLLETSKNMLTKYGRIGLRTLDSIQLASAITSKSENLYYISYDKLLLDFFVKENLKVYNCSV